MPCYKCGECCRRLYWSDRIRISWHSKTLMLSKVCKFLDKNSLCKVYPNRAQVCRNWICGAFKK